MISSPYTPGSVPTKLSGRADKLTRFREAAQRIESDALFVPRIHVDHGPRGVGKTSLLTEARRVFSSYHIRTVLITADPKEDLVLSLLSEMKQVVGPGGGRRKAALKAIDSASLSIGVPGLANASVTVKPDKTDTAASAKQFQRAMKATLEAIIGDGDSGLAILIDEVQEADPASLCTIAYAWQEMKPLQPLDRDQPRAALFAVGLPGAPTTITKAVTFSERFSFDQMGGLSPAGSREALESTANDVGIGWGRKALDRAVRESEGYPYKVQLLGDHAWAVATRRAGVDGLQPGDSIEMEDIEEALPLVRNDMLTLFSARWNNSSGKQQEMLIAIAKLGGEDVKRSVLAEALGSTTQAISVVRQRLLDKGLLDANKHGHLSFTVPGFTEYVIDQVDDD